MYVAKDKMATDKSVIINIEKPSGVDSPLRTTAPATAVAGVGVDTIPESAMLGSVIGGDVSVAPGPDVTVGVFVTEGGGDGEGVGVGVGVDVGVGSN